MTSHVVIENGRMEITRPFNISAPAPAINLQGFHWTTVDQKVHPVELREVKSPELRNGEQQSLLADTSEPSFRAAAQAAPLISPATAPTLDKPAPPFPLDKLQGAFAGNGFNAIWRPKSNKDPELKVDPVLGDPFPEDVMKKMKLGIFAINDPKKGPPPDNTLELNLTTEQLTFGETIGDIPNRGQFGQKSVILQGFPYVQTVQDVTNPITGKPGAQADSIHFEPGMWLWVPGNDSTPVKDPPSSAKGPTVVRMASIPHGTTINAQGGAPEQTTVLKAGERVNFGEASIKPFTANRVFDTNDFPSLLIANDNTLRLPQNLKPFEAAKSLDDKSLSNPNLLLAKALSGLTVKDFVTFEVSTGAPAAKTGAGGTGNIAFLQGMPADTDDKIAAVQPNAHAAFLRSRFWIETVEYTVTVPPLPKATPVLLQPTMPENTTAPTPTFLITPPPKGTLVEKTIKVQGTQLQYSQTVNLVFATLTWPHVSVATLVPKEPQPWTMTA